MIENTLTCLEQFEDVVDGDRSLTGILEVDFYHNFELSPPSLSHFIRRLCQCSVRIGVTVM